jgi:uncharacterized membrane protein YtjA (UPF0391 family)
VCRPPILSKPTSEGVAMTLYTILIVLLIVVLVLAIARRF